MVTIMIKNYFKLIISIVIILLFIGCDTYTTNNAEYVIVKDTIYMDSIIIHDTLYSYVGYDTIYLDTLHINIERNYNQTAFDNNEFKYLKATNAFSKTPVKNIDYKYNVLYKYYYMLNDDFLIVGIKYEN